ncbi:hypothetical protein Tsubulata_003108 [Turnera subulata]|uniref:Zinc knuckle CX2CX4HX4C domain-containing protein n=1 Tax=Turnera subulata TaxID=218843 RepID=A0A9Q0FW42_9ROSI|nr:hypothetical protein Tsubulata_003108 [Turnera subulata]
MASSSSRRVIDLGGESNDSCLISPEESLGVNVARTYVVGKILDKKKVLKGSPWLVSNMHFCLKGWFPDMILSQCYEPTLEAMLGWQGFIRARIEVLTDVPLLPCVACLDPTGKEIWMRFQYERLGEICYRRSRFTHQTSRCTKPSKPGEGIERPAEDSYGPWMRAKELLGKHYPAKKQVPLEGQDEQMENGKMQDQDGDSNADITSSLPDVAGGGSVSKKRKVMEEGILSSIKENARRAHTGMMNTVAELITDLHDASPIHTSASKPSWKKMARTTKVKYQPSNLELVQAFDMVAEGRGLELEGGQQHAGDIRVPTGPLAGE